MNEESIKLLGVVIAFIAITSFYIFFITHIKPAELKSPVLGVMFEKDDNGEITSLAIANGGDRTAEDLVIKVYIRGEEYDYPLSMKIGPDEFKRIDLKQLLGEKLDRAERIEIYAGDKLLGRKIKVS